MLQARAPQIGVRAPSSCHPRRAAMWGRQTPVQAQRPDLVATAAAPDPVSYFLDEPRIKAASAAARELRLGTGADPALLSDAVTPAQDGSTLQWVQLVMAGGGMLGVAHVGFVYVLEEAGLRFLGLGGTSAGAINAGLIASVRDTPADVSWKKTLQIMAAPGFTFAQFEDGDPLWSKLRTSTLTKLSLPSILKLAWTMIWNKSKLEEVWAKMGLNPGTTFRTWMADNMGNCGVASQADLDKKLALGSNGVSLQLRELGPKELTPGWIPDNPTPHEDITALVEGRIKNPLKLVASEVTTESKIVFPEDWPLFYRSATDAHPADYVRASMSVPLFFEPIILNDLPGAGKPSATWKATTGYEGPVPPKALFVDGGTLSNFPIDLFHDPTSVPLLPTLGVELGQDRNKFEEIDNPIELLAAMNNSSRHLSDREFLQHNADYSQLVQFIDTTGFNWLDFNMQPPQQRELFLRGAEAAVAFLQTWQESKGKWAAYKALRKSMIDQQKRE